ncbi:hypothetical protein HDV05_007062 [Chytridiales sp. JEL 0842]|nr:hypothetical protein HDV05_007062 [Chytridiales sp. JEL 0842]
MSQPSSTTPLLPSSSSSTTPPTNSPSRSKTNWSLKGSLAKETTSPASRRPVLQAGSTRSATTGYGTGFLPGNLRSAMTGAAPGGVVERVGSAATVGGDEEDVEALGGEYQNELAVSGKGDAHAEPHFGGAEIVRDVIVGMSDGLTVPFALAAGLASLNNTQIVVTAGMAEIVAGAISMGLGGYLAGRSEIEHYESERQREYDEIATVPEKEEEEIVEIFEPYGLDRASVEPLLTLLKKDHDKWVDFMMKFELSMERPDANRSWISALTIGGSYFLGGLVPLVPYMIFKEAQMAFTVSIVSTLLVLFVFGYVKATLLGVRGPLSSAIQMMVIGAGAAGCAYMVAKLLPTPEFGTPEAVFYIQFEIKTPSTTITPHQNTAMAVDALIIIPALAGIIATLQGAISAKMGAIAGDGFSSMITVICSSALGAIVWGIFEATGQGADYAAGMRDAPWWAYLGGGMGTFYVVVLTVCTHRLGASTFTVVVVFFQLASAILFDHLALVGLPQRQVTVGRLMGLLVGILGLVVMNFEGAWALWKARKGATKRIENDIEQANYANHVAETVQDEDAISSSSSSSATFPSDPAITNLKGAETEAGKTSLIKVSEKIPSFSNASDNVIVKKSLLSKIFNPDILLVALSGISLSLQAGMNSTLGISYKSAAFGTFVALVECIPLMALFFLTFQTRTFLKSFSAESIRATAKEAPWWSWTSGALGCGFVMAITFLSGRLGVAPFLGTAVSFQMVSAIVVDHFGWLGLPVRKANAWRCGGAFLLVLGAIGMILL